MNDHSACIGVSRSKWIRLMTILQSFLGLGSTSDARNQLPLGVHPMAVLTTRKILSASLNSILERVILSNFCTVAAYKLFPESRIKGIEPLSIKAANDS